MLVKIEAIKRPVKITIDHYQRYRLIERKYQELRPFVIIQVYCTFLNKKVTFSIFIFAKQGPLIFNRSMLESKLRLTAENTSNSCSFSKTGSSHNMVSICILKIVQEFRSQTRQQISWTRLWTDQFPSEQKKVSNISKNYHHISPLPLCDKIFNHLLYVAMFSIFL